MELYLVSKASQSETTTGVIEVAETTSFGIYTSSTRAHAIAIKHDATVTVFVADKEERTMLERWVNPGYIQNDS